MQLRLSLILMIAGFCFADSVEGQTLREELIAEDRVKLAQSARKDGNIVRGAILFHQGNINCAKCHRASAEKDRIGPDLSRLDQKEGDEFIVESILQPSKTIKQGFESTIVLTRTGNMINGIVFRQDAKQVVIRDSQDADKLISLDREDIDEIRPGTNSTMPDNLVDQLKNRQQFLDLVRYVIDVKQRGPSENVDSKTTARRQLKPELRGLALIQELNCVACHQSDKFESWIASKQSPPTRMVCETTESRVPGQIHS